MTGKPPRSGRQAVRARPDVELVYFTGCPNVAYARENLRAALTRAGLPCQWREWDLEDGSTPRALRRHPSPTVLVDGRDVMGEGESSAMACRTGPVPSVASILDHLERVRTGAEG